ncbi:hypothetical protein [Blastopirellula marina]|nr:hypothetical protein [Blastopirellula marina]
MVEANDHSENVDQGMPSSAYSPGPLESLSDDLEHVRERPRMYVGKDLSTESIHFVMEQLLDLTVRKKKTESISCVLVTVYRDGSVSVEDDGHGIATDIDPALSKRVGCEISCLEGVMRLLTFYRKISHWDWDYPAYQVRTGFHLDGCDLALTNLLSCWCDMEVYCDGFVWHQRYVRGVPQSPVQQGAATMKHGTKITFKLDADIFKTVALDHDRLAIQIQELADRHQGLTIGFKDERSDLS